MILRCIPCLDMFPTKTMKVTRKYIRHHCRSVSHWKEVSSWVNWQPWQCSWKEQLAREHESAKSMLFFENSIMGMWDYILCLPSWFPCEHFEALDFKIMFLANSVHLGFWNISWTYSRRPKKLFLWKIAFVCRTGTFCTQWCYRYV